MYNPILQSYADQNHEGYAKNIEKENLIDTLAKNKDRALRYEQTFNIINFDDKLKGLESHPDYPKTKSEVKNKKGGQSYTDYNILSNMNYQEHHYLPPDQRPKIKQEVTKEKKTTTTGLRDYNIVTNRYLELNDAK